MKKLLRKWLGVDEDIEKLKQKLRDAQNEINILGNHCGIWNRITFVKIPTEMISTQSICTDRIKPSSIP